MVLLGVVWLELQRNRLPLVVSQRGRFVQLSSLLWGVPVADSRLLAGLLSQWVRLI